MSTFAITAHGRSGTSYLAAVLNRSPTWTVSHEPGGNRRDLEEIQPRFEVVQPYGEVNSYLRWCFWRLCVDRRGVIIRDPRDIILSWINRNYWNDPEWGYDAVRDLNRDSDRIDELFQVHDEAFRLISNYAEEMDVTRISFTEMVTSRDYLYGVAHQMGIRDLDLGGLDLSVRINPNPHRHFPTLGDLPEPWRRYCRDRYDWFRKKWSRYI